MTATPRAARPLLALVACFAGPIIWAAHFMALYGMQAIMCSRLQHDDNVLAIRLAGAAMSGLAILGLAAVAYLPPARRRDFLGTTTRALLWLALPAIVWVSAMLVALPACDP